jgi:hypothetical protein
LHEACRHADRRRAKGRHVLGHRARRSRVRAGHVTLAGRSPSVGDDVLRAGYLCVSPGYRAVTAVRFSRATAEGRIAFGAAKKPLRPLGRCLGLHELHRLSLSRNMDALLTACSNVPGARRVTHAPEPFCGSSSGSASGDCKPWPADGSKRTAGLALFSFTSNARRASLLHTGLQTPAGMISCTSASRSGKAASSPPGPPQARTM